MSSIIIYLFESSVVLTLLYLVYLQVLRKETFFRLNRFYLLGILFISISFPALRFDVNDSTITLIDRPAEEVNKVRQSYYNAFDDWLYLNRVSSLQNDVTAKKSLYYKSVRWKKAGFLVLVSLYLVGVLFFITRTMFKLVKILKLINHNPILNKGGLKIIRLADPVAPFSFMNYVFVSTQVAESSSFSQILAHEKIHIEEQHSLDLIVGHILAAFFWFNPVVWCLLKSLKSTHEFIADEYILKSGYPLEKYQTLLLEQLISNNSNGLVHNFNLSFIKKRITMMRNNKSGWPGKVKVALVIVSTIAFSVLIVKCNSKLEDQLSLNNLEGTELSKGIELPIMPKTGFKFDPADPTDIITLEVRNNKIEIDGKGCKITEISQAIEKFGLSDHGTVIIRIDRNQTMGFVRDVQMELRKSDHRKLLYTGITDGGETVELPMLLPPPPSVPDRNGNLLPEIDDEWLSKNDYELLQIDLGENLGNENQNNVYEFVMGHVRRDSRNYVVSARFDNEDTFSDYLVNLHYIYNGFNQIYQERAQGMFGRDFISLDRSIPLEKEQYEAVRKDIPRAISIAEN